MAAFSSMAQAFEVVDWEWNSNVNTNVDLNVNVNVNVNVNGLVQIEKWQLHFGDVKAEAEVKGFHNRPGAAEGGEGVGNVAGTFDFTTFYNAFNGSFNCDDPNATVGTTCNDPLSVTDPVSGLTATLTDGQGHAFDSGPGNHNFLTFQIEVTGTVPAIPSDAFDAKDLPGIVNAATAVSNNQSITTNTALLVHDLQIAAGDFKAPRHPGGDEALVFLLGALGLFAIDDQLEDINENYDMAFLTILGAATGFIKPTDIEAKAKVEWVFNAFVDNAATAVGNNISLTVNPTTPISGAVVIADVTQLLIGDVEAKAKVEHVFINNYTNFGAAGFGLDPDDGSFTPIVKNIATAVGNNFSLNVNVPTPSVP